MKRLIAVLTTLALTITSLPQVAYADTTTTYYTDGSTVVSLFPESGINSRIRIDASKCRFTIEEISERSSNNGSPSSPPTSAGEYRQWGCFTDARLTGAFSGEYTLINVETGSTSLNYRMNVNQTYDTSWTAYGSESGYAYTKHSITYTPSAEDLAKGVYYAELCALTASSNASSSSVSVNINYGIEVTRPIKITGQTTISTSGFGLLFCGDIYDYLTSSSSFIYPVSTAKNQYAAWYNMSGGSQKVQFGISSTRSYYHNCGVISHAATGRLVVSDGSTTLVDVDLSNPTYNEYFYYTDNAKVFALSRSSGTTLSVTYYPTEADIQNGLKYGYYYSYKSYGFSSGRYYTTDSWYSITNTNTKSITCYDFALITSDFPTPGTTDPISSFSSSSVSKPYGSSSFSAGFTTNSDGTISYSSSNTSVATVASNGTITIKGAGSTVITASTTETSAYNADSKTMALTVTKGNLTIKTSPTPTVINYGQKLSTSVLSGGSAVNSSGSNVGGSWSWKSPETFPSAGTISYTVVFVPTDTVNYNY